MEKKKKGKKNKMPMGHSSLTSVTATADMQMLCNIFPILSLQLMKGSSFKQFLVLKKNICSGQSMERDDLNKLLITFQQ